MKSYRKELWFKAPTRMAFINITSEIQECLRESGVKIRPRAILTTLYSRLFLSDLFIHGIGGAKYDAWTKLKGMGKHDAVANYIKQVEKLNRD